MNIKATRGKKRDCTSDTENILFIAVQNYTSEFSFSKNKLLIVILQMKRLQFFNLVHTMVTINSISVVVSAEDRAQDFTLTHSPRPC